MSTVKNNIVIVLTQGHGSTGLGCSIVLFLLGCMGVLHSHVSETSPLHACTVREGVHCKQKLVEATRGQTAISA